MESGFLGFDIQFWIVVAIIFVLCPYLVFKIAKKTNRNAVIWTVASFLTNPILALIVIGILAILEQTSPDMPKWMASLITKIDLFSKWVGNIVCWITIPLIFAMVFEVFARKLFIAPTMWAYDMSRFFYGALFMLGAGYALSKGVHIRADFLYRNFKVKNQGLVDFWLYILFYFPGLLVFLYMTIGFVQESIMRGEKGTDTAWMPYLWPIKSCLLIGIIFLLIQGISELFKSYWAATKGKWPGKDK